MKAIANFTGPTGPIANDDLRGPCRPGADGRPGAAGRPGQIGGRHGDPRPRSHLPRSGPALQ